MAVAAYMALRPLEDSLVAIQKLHETERIKIDIHQIGDLRKKVLILLQFLEAFPPHRPLHPHMRTLAHQAKVTAVETELFLASKITHKLRRNDEELQLFTQALDGTIQKLESMVLNMSDMLVFDIKDMVKSVLCLMLEAQFGRLFMPQLEDNMQDIIFMFIETQLYLNKVVMGHLAEEGDCLSSFLKGVMEKLQSMEKKMMIADDDVGRVSDISSSLIVSPKVDSREKTVCVGLEEKVSWMTAELTSHEKSLQIIPIVGMGGIGKTTLVRHLSENPIIKRRFDICKWCTISIDYDERRILQSLLADKSDDENRELGGRLHQSLYGRRYLIILDDMWSIDPWEYLKKFFPDNQMNSRVIITTRMKDVADAVNSRRQCVVNLLDEELSWKLFCEKIFGRYECPSELEKLGRSISKKCKGLPISLVTIAGVLSKSNMTLEYWENVEQNVTEVSGFEDCTEILALSYYYLPIHLKPCFLWFSKYNEDQTFNSLSMVLKWIGEGFLKPVVGRVLEDVAFSYMNELVDRNLIWCSKSDYLLDSDICGIHDLLLRVSQIESKKGGILPIPRTSYFGAINLEDLDLEDIVVSQVFSSQVPGITRFAYIDGKGYTRVSSHLDLWNIRILRISGYSWTFPLDIWEMQQLRYVTGGMVLPRPPRIDTLAESKNYHHPMILEHLQFLFTYGLSLGEEIVKRIPNLKSLRLSSWMYEDLVMGPLSIVKFEHLKLLELYDVTRDASRRIKMFPPSLKELRLESHEISREHIAAMSSLQFLETLALVMLGSMDEELIVSGKFPRLRYLRLAVARKECMCLYHLKIEESGDLEKLEKLVLVRLSHFEFPSSIENLAALISIKLHSCNDSIITSAKQMLQEQGINGNDTLELYVNGKLFELPDDEVADIGE